ncbi:MAG: acyl-CoA dehydrogenase family protein [Chloroflexi bacterium]|nr:acyl-CoA dehydrogenase family protein [Chloroflexota bacterium]
MNFELRYTKAQEDFRQEVRDWLDANAHMPPALGAIPLESMDTTREQWEWIREFYRKLGHQGWFYPTMPKEYGGGGLSLDHEIIIQEELARYKVPSLNSPGNVAIAALYIYGTEEQKQRFLKPILLGETVTWQLWTEPDSGVDLASITTRAVKDGDDYIINGTKNYISGIFEPDYLNILVVTDPHAPRHANLGQFYSPANLPGISWVYQDLIVKGGQHFIFFEDVRVPRECLVGGETEGWRVTQSSLELEHGAEGSLTGRENVVGDLVQAWREGKVHSLAHGAAAQERLVDAYIRSTINRLIARRTFWMFHTKQPQSYHGPQNLWFGRETRIRTADDLLDLLGPHALTTDPEWRLLDGRVELGQRGAAMATHGAGSYEIDKVIIARRVGLSRTRDVAAPTH